MSPRAACRLETLRFCSVYDYVGGKAEWLANGLLREGEKASVLYAGEAVDNDPRRARCMTRSRTSARDSTARATASGWCSASTASCSDGSAEPAIQGADAKAPAESVMEPGPSTVRFDIPARDLVQRLAGKDLKTAIVTTPSGCLVGVFHPADAEKRVAQPAAPKNPPHDRHPQPTVAT
jgi:hypothetical protein